MNGKGSRRRPSSVSNATFADAWARIFENHWVHYCDETSKLEKTQHGLQCPRCGVQEEWIKRTKH